MGRKAKILNVKETVSELKQLHKQIAPHLKARVQMLVLIKTEKAHSKQGLADALGVNHNSAQSWKQAYEHGGIKLLLSDRRGGKKQSLITPQAHLQLEQRLNNPQQGFRSFGEIRQWLLDEFNIAAHYQTVNKYIKRRFGAGLKVARKSHVLKRPADEAVFKNFARKI